MLPCIISDIDGVLVDIISEACDWLWLRYHKVVAPEDITSFEISECLYEYLHVPQDEFKEECRKRLWHNPQFYRDARPYYTLWQTYLAWPAFKLRFITKRPKAYGIARATADWLFLHGFECSGLNLAFCDGSSGKREAILQIQKEEAHNKDATFIYIEDSMKEMLVVAEDTRIKNMSRWLIARPWNEAEFRMQDFDGHVVRRTDYETALTLNRMLDKTNRGEK